MATMVSAVRSAEPTRPPSDPDPEVPERARQPAMNRRLEGQFERERELERRREERER